MFTIPQDIKDAIVGKCFNVHKEDSTIGYFKINDVTIVHNFYAIFGYELNEDGSEKEHSYPYKIGFVIRGYRDFRDLEVLATEKRLIEISNNYAVLSDKPIKDFDKVYKDYFEDYYKCE